MYNNHIKNKCTDVHDMFTFRYKTSPHQACKVATLVILQCIISCTCISERLHCSTLVQIDL